MSARRAALLAGVLVLAGCGGSSGATSVLSKTAAGLGDIRSGDLGFSLLVTPRGDGAGPPFGFKLAGPFSLRKGSAPQAKIDYTQLANGKSSTVTITSTGTKGYVTLGGKTYELPAARLGPIKSVTSALGGNGKGSSLPVDRWIVDPKVSDGGNVGGVETDHVQGTFDIAQAAGDLGSQVLGNRALDDRERKQLADATRSARIDVWSGKKDHLLRKLAIDVDLGFDVPADLRAALGKLVGARIALELTVDGPNRPVSVTAPANPQPYPG
jgi:hypothetical protein